MNDASEGVTGLDRFRRLTSQIKELALEIERATEVVEAATRAYDAIQACLQMHDDEHISLTDKDHVALGDLSDALDALRAGGGS